MNIHNASDWFQIVASIGVLTGLLLVGYELRRNEGINIGTLTYQTLENQQNSLLAIAGENPAAALTKACLNPDALTDEDFFVLDAIYAFRTDDVIKVEAVQLRGDYDISSSIDAVARFRTSAIASTIPGRAWLEANMSEIPTSMKSYAVAELKNPTKDCHSTMSRFIDRTRQLSGHPQND